FFLLSSFFSSILLPPPLSTLFPYTTLFRSCFVKGFGGILVKIFGQLLGNGRAYISSSFEDLPHGTDQLFRGSFLIQVTGSAGPRSEEHTSELQSLRHLVCRLLLEKKKKKKQ